MGRTTPSGFARGRVCGSFPAMGKLLILGGALVLAGCGSAYQRCQTAAAFEQDPIARELARNRCEEIANREAAREMHSEDSENYRERTERWEPPPTASVQNQPPAPSVKTPPEPMLPSRCVVWTPSSPSAPTAFVTDIEAVEDLRAAKDSGVGAADYVRLFEKRGGLWIAPGTKCRFLQILPNGAARVRLLEGEHAGVDGWITLPRAQTGSE